MGQFAVRPTPLCLGDGLGVPPPLLLPLLLLLIIIIIISRNNAPLPLFPTCRRLFVQLVFQKGHPALAYALRMKRVSVTAARTVILTTLRTYYPETLFLLGAFA